MNEDKRNLLKLREAEESEYCSAAPFPPLLNNQWRCKNKNCRALLGLADPVTLSCLHIYKGGTPPASDIMIYDLGGLAIRQICRRCQRENWVMSEGVKRPNDRREGGKVPI